MAQVHPRFDRTGLFHSERRLDSLIEAYVPAGARVIDLGCGSGELLERLIRTRKIFARGVEISEDGVKACIYKGLSVYQGDIDDGFEDFDDNAFDVVVLNLTLSMLHYPDRVMREALRLGRRGVISFYNGGYRARREAFAETGRVDALLPGEWPWYQNPHINFFSVDDFEALCKAQGIEVRDRTFVDEHFEKLAAGDLADPQNYAYAGVYLLERKC